MKLYILNLYSLFCVSLVRKHWPRREGPRGLGAGGTKLVLCLIYFKSQQNVLLLDFSTAMFTFYGDNNRLLFKESRLVI